MPFGELRDRWCTVVVSSCRELLGQVPLRAQPSLPVADKSLPLFCSLARLPVIHRRQVGTTSTHHPPYVLGYTRVPMGRTTRSPPAMERKSRSAAPSSDRGLKPACVQAEALVNAEQHGALNAFPGLVHTA